jgi:very-short-patch-repair endonuclease
MGKVCKDNGLWGVFGGLVMSRYNLLHLAFKQTFPIECVPEYKFHPKRRWRIDFAFPEIKLAVEIEGGVWQNGRHNRGSGFIKDMEKYNNLTLQGWRLLRFTSTEADQDITKILDMVDIIYKEKVDGLTT